MKKFINVFLVLSMLATSGVAALAKAPSEYDGVSYGDLGYTSDDSDGQFNLAVIANGDVKIGNAMTIDGSVYSNGTIYVHHGQGNTINGLFISATQNDSQYVSTWSQDSTGAYVETRTNLDGYYAIEQYNDNLFQNDTTYFTKPVYAGAIYDDSTSFECSYEDFDVPSIDNNAGSVEMNVYGNTYANNLPQTVSEDTYYESVTMNGSQYNGSQYEAGLVVDTTNGPVSVVINELPNAVNPSIMVVGENEAYIYINNANTLSNLSINYTSKEWPPAKSGASEKTHVFVSGDTVSLNASYINVADMKVNASSLTIAGATTFYGNVYSNAETFTITGGQTNVYGTVCVPNADSKVVDSGTLYGQLHTNTLSNNGAGRIIWQKDSSVKIAEKPTAEPTTEPTQAPSGDPAACVQYDLKTGVMTPGFMHIKNNRPHSWAAGTDANDKHIVNGFDDVWYTVLDERTFAANDYYIPEDLRSAALNVADLSSSRLSFLAKSTQVQYGRIDSQAWKGDYISRNQQGTLWMTPFIAEKLENDFGVTRDKYIWLAMGDTAGNITTVWVMDRALAAAYGYDVDNLNTDEDDGSYTEK